MNLFMSLQVPYNSDSFFTNLGALPHIVTWILCVYIYLSHKPSLLLCEILDY